MNRTKLNQNTIKSKVNLTNQTCNHTQQPWNLELVQKNLQLHRRFFRYYKKHTLAIFFSFALTFLLASAILVLIHTNHRIENIQYQAVFSPSDCYITELSAGQIKKLRSRPGIEHLAVAGPSQYCTRNGQQFFLSSGDDTQLTMTAKLLEGRLPDTAEEIAAEKWVLLNLGIEPVLNQEFTFEDSDGKDRTVTLTGILSDQMANKIYGTLYLYAGLEIMPDCAYIVYIRFQNPAAYDASVRELVSYLGIQKDQVRKNPAREDFMELYWMDVRIAGVIFLVCYIVFYGIYRIALAARRRQYGILRAVGMKRGQLQVMILRELYRIYVIGTAAGILSGIALAYVLVWLSGDRDSVVYLYNESVRFAPVVPAGVIAACAAAMAVFAGLTAYLEGRKIAAEPPVQAVSGTGYGKKRLCSLFRVKKTGGKLRTLFSLSGSYIFRDIRTSAFMLLTACTGAVLFTGLAYQAQILKTDREDTKETWYLNGQYEMSVLSFDNPFQGISREDAKDVESLDETAQVKTAAGLPVRVIDDGRKRNDAYYDKINAGNLENRGYELRGHDGTDQIYKSVLYGYNEPALKELKKYIISGDFDPQHLKEDEVIVSVLSMYGTEEVPGSYKDGKLLMDYQAGERIRIKYRADFKTGDKNYETLQDAGAQYCYREYKIAAVVSFQYIADSRRTVYPLLITSDAAMQSIVPDGCFQCMYIDTAQKEPDAAAQDRMERRLIQIGAGSKCHVTTRSLISEIKKNEMYYRKQMIYVYGIAAIGFVLVFLNMSNNLNYRMYARTREICMLRAAGLSVSMARRMLLMENMMLGTAAVILAFFLTHPALKYLYRISGMKAQGHAFSYHYAAFGAAAAVVLAVCAVLSLNICREWKSRHIMEAIG